ncbi:hypothetical protein KZZ52_20970 [Dactylosporangium sp. AC04546]|uniref:hypothetical protein n=1 Tax=Dactylosporangium sp. AC04546 TaxID=2862460 RepID=UPI001EE075F1|nr:hypothetical protein [Dactylosporangium sp. AC04546]WVK87759.1 hypothetical protein KZZ52_20970 [Dactylosporangium sp. AC04546]
MHRVSWALAGAAVIVCVVSAVLDRPWSTLAALAAVVMLGVGLVLAYVNGRGIQGQWERNGVRAEFVVERAAAEFSDDGHTRFSIHGRVDGGPSRRYEAYVRTMDAGLVTDGARFTATVLAADPDSVRLHLRPPEYVVLQARS